MNILSVLSERLREKGLVGTTLIIWSHLQDLAFDWRYKTDTLMWHELRDLHVVGDNKPHGTHYQPTQARSLWKVLKKLDFAPTGAFLDLGCGKGRVLILAAEYGYRRVLGVEFSAELCSAAEQNLECYHRRASAGTEFQVVNADAAEYVIPDDVSVVFMFNPFDASVMEPVIRNIEASLRRKPRPLDIVYRNPVHREVIDASTRFQVTGTYQFPQCDFLVYHASEAN